MKFIFSCGICKSQYCNFFDALKCELKGTPEVDDFSPGLMHEINMHGKFIGIFAIAEVRIEGHNVTGALFACRPLPMGDNHEGMFCGMDFSRNVKEYRKGHFITEGGKQQPEFQRMCELLKSKGIIPKFYDENGKLYTV